jgi:hypothetical protein
VTCQGGSIFPGSGSENQADDCAQYIPEMEGVQNFAEFASHQSMGAEFAGGHLNRFWTSCSDFAFCKHSALPPIAVVSGSPEVADREQDSEYRIYE